MGFYSFFRAFRCCGHLTCASAVPARTCSKLFEYCLSCLFSWQSRRPWATSCLTPSSRRRHKRKELKSLRCRSLWWQRQLRGEILLDILLARNLRFATPPEPYDRSLMCGIPVRPYASNAFKALKRILCIKSLNQKICYILYPSGWNGAAKRECPIQSNVDTLKMSDGYGDRRKRGGHGSKGTFDLTS